LLNIALATYDLIPEKAHLMPWRTICEVTHYTNESNDTALIFNLVDAPLIDSKESESSDVTLYINKHRSELASSLRKRISEHNIDVLYWPITWREFGWRIDMLETLNVNVVIYFPGGVYNISSVIYSIRKLGIRTTFPYLIDAISNKKKLMKRLKNIGIRKLIGLTEYTVEKTREAGWSVEDSHFISLAKDNKNLLNSEAELPSEFLQWCVGAPYYLFMGPPSGIRGIYELLSAFEIAATKNADIRLVCLFRSDADLETQKIKRIIASSTMKHRIYCIWQSVERTVLNAYMAASHAITMPFVLVPSEIPLAIIEAMQFSKPVITTKSGGTGDFVERFGFAPAVGNIDGLASAMIELAENDVLYKQKCESVREHYKALPDWQKMSASWLEVGSFSLKYGNI
jgi:glycosyltransferase involved in cell wall biosynthesis